jgi:preprotein translocase subunit SecD
MLRFECWKVCTIIGLCLLGGLFAMPNFFPEATVRAWPNYMPKSRVSLGLDVTGGVEMIFKANRESLRDSVTKVVREQVRLRLREAKIGYTALGVTSEGIRVRLLKPIDQDAAMHELRKLIGMTGGTLLAAGAPDLKVKGEADGTIVLTPTEAAIDARLIPSLDAKRVEISRECPIAAFAGSTVERRGESIIVQVPNISSLEVLHQTVRGLCARI